jgi:hypothetical protein
LEVVATLTMRQFLNVLMLHLGFDPMHGIADQPHILIWVRPLYRFIK